MKKIDFVQFVIVVMAVCVAMYGCAQIKAVLNENPELVVKIGDLISDVIEIAGSELIEVAMRGDRQEYRYDGKKLKTSAGTTVKNLMVRDGRVISIGGK